MLTLVALGATACAHPVAIRPAADLVDVSEPTPEARAPEDVAPVAAAVEDVPPVPPPAIASLVENARYAPFRLQPQDPIRVGCDVTSCLAVWVESGAVLAASLDPLATSPRTIHRAPGSRLVRVAALVPHPRGFAFLRYVSRTFEVAALELCVVDREGSLLSTVPLGEMHGNSTDPDLSIAGERALVGMPSTSTRVAFVELANDVVGARRSTTDAHATTADVAHDGTHFVESWLVWERGGPTMRVRTHVDGARERELPFLSSSALACRDGRCVVAGESERRVTIVAIAADGTSETRVVGPLGSSTASVLAHDAGLLVVARADSGATLAMVGPDAPSDTVVARGLPVLVSRGGDRYLGYAAEDPPDYERMEYPCPGDESSTCMERPAYARLRITDVRVSVAPR